AQHAAPAATSQPRDQPRTRLRPFEESKRRARPHRRVKQLQRIESPKRRNVCGCLRNRDHPCGWLPRDILWTGRDRPRAAPYAAESRIQVLAWRDSTDRQVRREGSAYSWRPIAGDSPGVSRNREWKMRLVAAAIW